MNWLVRIAQKYPGGEFLGPDWQGKPRHDIDIQGKLRNWGIEPPEDWERFRTLAQDARLSFISSKHVNLIVEHLTDKHFPSVKPALADSLRLCENNSYIYWDYDEEKQPEIGQAFDQLAEDIAKHVQPLLQRAEIRDEEFTREMIELVQSQIDSKFKEMIVKQISNDTFFVRVYGSSKAFGGAEEGGWWYDNNQLVHQEQVQGLQAACERKAAFEKEYKDKGEDSFYDDLEASGAARDLYNEESSAATGMGDLSYDTRDVEGMDFPKGWTTSSFERFFVQVELNPEPREQTQGIPHFE